MWGLFYRFVLGPMGAVATRALSLGSEKVRRGFAGRRAQHAAPANAPPVGSFAIHVHAASVGEFEQAKPVIEMLRREVQPYRITTSFYSPSGFEQQGRYSAIDAAYYLPEDLPSHTRRFFDQIAPDLIVIVRYDLWPAFLSEANARGIPCVLICGTMNAGSVRLRFAARRFFMWLYGKLSLILCVDESDAAAFGMLAPNVPSEVTGDTRYDRVIERASVAGQLHGALARSQFGQRVIVVAGSTWEPDERMLEGLVHEQGIQLIIVPHEPTPSNVAHLRRRFTESVVLSELAAGADVGAGKVLIVDRTGVLLALYSLADIAYVGGGFDAGVHSVLEPAAYGIPVFAGPNIVRSRDATRMHDRALLAIVTSARQFSGAVMSLALDEASRKALGLRTAAFVNEHAGATETTIEALRRRGLLPVASLSTASHE